jgi:NTE family protein
VSLGNGSPLRGLLRRWAWKVQPPVLALGGGGARGFAHIGVLQVLQELGLAIQGVVGTSMGAVIGAMYLVHGSAAKVEELWREARRAELIPTVRTPGSVPGRGEREHPLVQVARRIRSRVVVSFAVNRTTMLDDKALVRAFEFLLPEGMIEDVKPLFVAVATDLATGEEVLLTKGDLRNALRASSAIPGVLPAVTIDGRPLVDGGVVAEVPLAAARRLKQPVVAVDVSMRLPPLETDSLVLDTMIRAQMMTARLLRERQLARCRRLIRPDVGHTTWAAWDRFDELVQCGRQATLEWFGLTSRDALPDTSTGNSEEVVEPEVDSGQPPPTDS